MVMTREGVFQVQGFLSKAILSVNEVQDVVGMWVTDLSLKRKLRDYDVMLADRSSVQILDSLRMRSRNRVETTTKSES